MKKIVLCILIIFILISIISCKDNTVTEKYKNSNTNSDNNKEIIMEDVYFFRSFRTYGDDGIGGPTKINPASKNNAFICSDPLCSHGVDCVFIDTGNYYISGNYLLFIKSYNEYDELTKEAQTTSELQIYEMINGSVRKLTKFTEQPIFVGKYKNYFYYYLPTLNEEGTRPRLDYILFRADAKSGNVTEIASNSYNGEIVNNLNYPNILAIIDDEIYWYSMDMVNLKINYYTTDLDGKNKKTLDIARTELTNGLYDNGYIYYCLNERYNITFEELMQLSEYENRHLNQDNKLYRIPFDNIESGEEAELIAEHVINFLPCGDKIYYMVLEDNPEHIEYPDIETWNWSGGKIYVMNSDGGDKRLLCETGYNLNTDVYTVRNSIIEVKTIDEIDYLAWSFIIVQETERHGTYLYSLAASTDTIIINASTGEFTVVSVPE